MLGMLLETAQVYGLSEYDSKNAKIFLDNNEFGLCFDSIITQLYEYNIEIDHDFYVLVDKIGKKMNLPLGSYVFIKEMVKSENNSRD